MLTRVLVLVLSASLAACSMTDKAEHFEGLSSPDGSSITHVNTTNVGLNLLFVIPLVGDATLDDAVRDLAREAKQEGATKVRLVQSDSTNYWWALPPFTFILSPVVSNAAGDALR